MPCSRLCYVAVVQNHHIFYPTVQQTCELKGKIVDASASICAYNLAVALDYYAYCTREVMSRLLHSMGGDMLRLHTQPYMLTQIIICNHKNKNKGKKEELQIRRMRINGFSRDGTDCTDTLICIPATHRCNASRTKVSCAF